MAQRIGRRTFLRASVGAALAGVAYGADLGLPGGATPAAQPAQARPARRVLTTDLRLDPSDLARGSLSGVVSSPRGLKLGSGRRSGRYLSPVLRSDLAFDYAGVYWSGDYPAGSAASFELRTSPDGRAWSAWQPVQVEMPPGPLAQYDTYGSLIWAEFAAYVQFRAHLRGDGRRPAIHRVGLTLLNTRDGPALESATEEARSRGRAAAAGLDSTSQSGAATAALFAAPVTFTREDWGADESLRYSGGSEIWPRSYVPTKKLVVHHTVTRNSYDSVDGAKADVRAVYTYHATSQGWGDIGYNCLIDKFGNSYEGRRGRDGPGYDGPGGREVLSADAVAGHALAYNHGSAGVALLGTFSQVSPSGGMVSRLKDVLAWICQRHGINPEGNSHFLRRDEIWHYSLHNLVGHRDVGETACPGGYAYNLLPQVRRDVAARLASPGAPVVFLTAAPPEGTVYNSAVDYAWTGGGSAPLEYSYYLEGWSRDPNTGDTNYIRGFTGQGSPDWTPWSAATTVRLCFVAPGLYTFHLRVRDSTGRVGVYHETRTFLGTAQTDICDGALVKGSTDAVHVVQAGLRRHVPNLPTFEAQRFLWTNINHVPDATLYAIPAGQPLLDALADGNLLRGSGPEVYAMQSGLKRHVTSPAVMDSCQYGWDAIYAVPNSLASIATGDPLYGPPCPHLSPPQGSLVKGPGPEVYLIQQGIKRHVPNPVSFFAAGLLWGNISTIPGSSLSTIPTGQPLLDSMADGNLLKGSGPEVYVMQSGLRRHVTSPAVMDSCQYGWDAVQFVPDWLLATISTAGALYGPPCPHVVPPHGVLIQGTGPQVYLMQLGLKRHIPNPVTLEARGLLWGNINLIPNSALNTISTGQPLLDALADGNLLMAGGPEVYAMEDGAKRLIDGAGAMNDCNYGTDAVQVITNSLLASIPGGASLSGPPCPHLLPPDGALVKGTAPAVYVMENGLKRHVADPNAFHGCGYQWGNINLIPDSSLTGIPTGSVLTDPPCPESHTRVIRKEGAGHEG